MSTEKLRVLGIDLGANSLGTALIDWSNQDVLFTGVRIFQAGVANLNESREESRNVARRLARQQRRQTDRRRRRTLNLFRLLQQAGLLPEGERIAVLRVLDQQLEIKYHHPHTLPYLLRSSALDEPLPPHELGRALYHLGQRRGFLSSRKSGAKQDEDKGKVKQGIKQLKSTILASGFRTLGEYYASLNPHRENEKIRGRYTHRSMFKEEFDLIWAAQAPHHQTVLNENLRTRLSEVLFCQRPLKDQLDLVGACDLVPSEKRAPMASLLVQRFRFLTFLNNLRLINTEGVEFALEAQQRELILALAENSEKLTMPALKKKLKLPEGYAFTIEQGTEKSHPGMVLSARLRKRLGNTWDQLSNEKKSRLVDLLRDADGTEESLAAQIQQDFAFDAEAASTAVDTPLPPGYFSVSLAAIQKMMSGLEQGTPYATVRRQVFPEKFVASTPADLLPRILSNPSTPSHLRMPEIRNPIVVRALTELRKTVNAIIREYGKPDLIHIELARELKRNVEDRLEYSKQADLQAKKREEAKQAIATYRGGVPTDQIRRSEVDKYLLWMECGHHCPYTGRTISMEALFGDHALFHIEHIIPFRRSLDDSLDNKTLCYHETNALKRNRTPWEVFGQTDEWDTMVHRVKAFRNPRKLKRFVMKETDVAKLLEEFSERQLNDTRYASRLAAQYLGLLFGGVVDAEGKKRVMTCSGGVTSWLRNEWDLNRILNPDSPQKSRDDHRHHAIDAVTVAMCSQSMVQRLGTLAEEAEKAGRRRFATLGEPWAGFRLSVQSKVLATEVSMRPEYKLKTEMHDQTVYSKRQGDGDKFVRLRTDVFKAKPEDIVDPHIRNIVLEKIAIVGSAAKLENNWPTLQTPNGQVPIKKVRVREKAGNAIALGKGARRKVVLSNSIHHTEIVRNEEGKKVCFDHYPVTTFEAMDRLRRKVDLVQKEHGERKQLICTLRPGDMLLCARDKQSEPLVWLVRTVKSSGQTEMQVASDARQKAKVSASGGIWAPVVNTLFADPRTKKIRIDHLGRVVKAND